MVWQYHHVERRQKARDFHARKGMKRKGRSRQDLPLHLRSFLLVITGLQYKCQDQTVHARRGFCWEGRERTGKGQCAKVRIASPCSRKHVDIPSYICRRRSREGREQCQPGSSSLWTWSARCSRIQVPATCLDRGQDACPRWLVRFMPCMKQDRGLLRLCYIDTLKFLELFHSICSWDCNLLASLQRTIASEPNIPLCCGTVSVDMLLEEC